MRATPPLGWGLLFLSFFASVPAHAGGHPVSAGRPYVASVDYRVDGYRPKSVPAEALPGYHTSVIKLTDANRPVDARGVALWLHNGYRLYNPLVIAWYGVDLLNSYRVTQDPAYLDRAETNASFLINRAVSRDGALYFPYRFSFGLFGNRHDLMRAPWYSALAQGAALTLFLRLHAAIGEQRWRTAADSTFSHVSATAKRQAAMDRLRPA